MDEFGSPIAGGIRAVRRSVSSSVFQPVQRQEPVQPQPDTITTNLLSQNSLQLSSISTQLQTVATQISSLNFSLNGIKENLAISDNLERQREAAKQNRERILAEQGLREGKESGLERKIQFALTAPIRKIGAKAQGILSRLGSFFLFLAGGWLTMKGFDLLKAQSEGNTDKLKELQSQFTKGLLVVGATFTALQIGIGTTISLLARFTGTVARVAFGGILRGALRGVTRLLSNAAGGAIGGLVGGGLTQIARSIGGSILTFLGIKGVEKGYKKSAAAIQSLGPNAIRSSSPDYDLMQLKKMGMADQYDDIVRTTPSGGMPKGNVLPDGTIVKQKGFFGRTVDKVKNIFKPAAKTAAKTTAKKGILSFMKGAVGKLLGKLGGPFLTFIFNLTSGEGVGSALAAAAGFAAGAALGQILIPIPIVGGLIGGILGETILKNLFKGIMRLFGFKVKSDDKDKVDSLPQLGYQDMISVPQNESENIEPIDNKSDEKALNISELSEGEPTVINLPAVSQANNVPQVTKNSGSTESNPLPVIPFDTTNPHTLYATATYGV